MPDDIPRYTAAEQWFSNWMVADSPQNVAGVIDDDGATIFPADSSYSINGTQFCGI